MSGLLDGLPTLTAPVSVKDERGEHRALTNAIAWVKRDDVRALLRNPSPAMMFDLRRAVDAALAHASIDATMDSEAFIVRAVLAALAGDDR